MDAGRAQRQIEGVQPGLIPHALAEDTHGAGPADDVLTRGVEVRAERERERHFHGRALKMADRLEGNVGEAAQPLRCGHRQR